MDCGAILPGIYGMIINLFQNEDVKDVKKPK